MDTLDDFNVIEDEDPLSGLHRLMEILTEQYDAEPVSDDLSSIGSHDVIVRHPLERLTINSDPELMTACRG